MSDMQPVSFIKQFIPPLFLTLIKSRSNYGWKGNYRSWQEAEKNSDAYDADLILEKVKQSLLKVKNGEAVYERDSVLFDEIQYSWPLLAVLLWVSVLNNGKLKVADFGGSLGSSYFQNRKFLQGLSELQWNVLEQNKFVECGQHLFQDEKLQFFFTPGEMIAQKGLPDLLIFSCVLPYLEKPYELLESMIRLKIPYILIDNTYFNFEQRDRICIQRVPPDIYPASYPCWMLDYENIKRAFSGYYDLVSVHQNDSVILLDGKQIRYRGLLFKIKG